MLSRIGNTLQTGESTKKAVENCCPLRFSIIHSKRNSADNTEPSIMLSVRGSVYNLQQKNFCKSQRVNEGSFYCTKTTIHIVLYSNIVFPLMMNIR